MLLSCLFALLLLLCFSVLYFVSRGFSTLKVFLSLCLMLAVGALGLYNYYGSFHADESIQHDNIINNMREKLLNKFRTPEILENTIKQKLKTNPNQVMGWILLGRLQASQNKFVEASDSFTQAIKLQDPNKVETDVWVQYANALFFAHQKQETPELTQVLERIQKQNAMHPGFLNLMALIAFSKKDYEQAIQYWQKLLVLLPEESEAHAQISQAILRAQFLLHPKSPMTDLKQHVPN